MTPPPQQPHTPPQHQQHTAPQHPQQPQHTAPQAPAAVPGSALEPAQGGTELLPDGLLRHMRADPLHAPEFLALAAVERYGKDAQAWVDGVRRQFPAAHEANLANLVRTRFVRLSRLSGAAAGITGAPGAVVDFGVLAWNQARMVIHLAAVYGQDPTSRERAAEILVLQDVHTITDQARAALESSSRQASALDLVRKRDGSAAQLATSLAKMVGMKMLKRGVMKVIPLASIPLGAMANAGSTKRLADKAIAMYAQRRFPPPG